MLAVGRRSQGALNNRNPRQNGVANNDFEANRSCRLNFYEDLPPLDVDIDTFEAYGISRLQGGSFFSFKKKLHTHIWWIFGESKAIYGSIDIYVVLG